MTDSQDAPAVAGTPEVQEGVGPFTVREVSLLGVWLVAFVVSFFPLAGFESPSVWTAGLTWILTIGVPTVATGLVVLRRFSPEGIRRVGSLGIDQFASVAFSVSAVVWLGYVWAAVAAAVETGLSTGWVPWVELVLMLAGVVLTVFAPFIPVFAADFAGRVEVPAHRAARPVRPVTARERAPRPPKEPKAPKPAKAPKPRRDAQDGAAPQGSAPEAAQSGYAPQSFAPQPAYGQSGADAQGLTQPGYDPQQYDTAAYAQPGWDPQAYGRQAPTDAEQPAQDDPFAALAVDEVVVTEAAPVSAQQAFWALAPVERDVVDQNGQPLFRIGPSAWALVIEDRGTAFVVRDEDGRTGYLLDVSGVTRG